MATDSAELEARKDWTSASFDDGRSALRRWRESNTRRSEEIVEIWEHVISRHPTSLDDELWVVYEQVCIAALDCARMDLAELCWKALDKRFGRQSHRVFRLKAMMCECYEQYSDAVKIYDKIIELDPTNTACMKRKIACLRSKGELDKAAEDLSMYLQTFINDNEAWMELADIYLALHDYNRAAHCLEELLLSQPMNALLATRYADVRYSCGGSENVELARQYYVHACKLQNDALRPAFGLLLACNWLFGKATSAQRKKELFTEAQWAVDQIGAAYSASNATPNNTATAQSILDSMSKDPSK